MVSPVQMRFRRGSGYLAGEFPDGITTVGGVPVGAEVRILYRPETGEPGDGLVVASTRSATDGTWRVNGLNPALRYDVVGRKVGFNDIIMADVSPALE
ncbi:hypothetical protein PA86_03331 [Pseudomonas aeruginosa]|nr:hypothetical protein AOA76_25320 [Pseudomonas aeruginosa]QBN00342.1 hypothetical protein CKAES1M_03717 [Pseudomonas aeruginosa]QBN04530.1 hypothetical protein CKAES1R_02010 [Pseudomonas aeruginosa]RCL96720.1 hypothetical protein PA66_02477 [Pseudomonas aeruginosa]RCM03284.1 hypothetical protein PA86_03331 [Pseudomonas aeruginosa]